MGFPFIASYIAVWILVIFQGLLILALLKQLAEVKQLARLGGVAGAEPLPAGTPAPDFEGVDLRSAKRLTKQVFAGQGGVLLFLSPECGSCLELADGLRRSELTELLPILTFCQGDESPCATFINRLGPEIYTLRGDFEDGSVAKRYHVDGSPTAVVINPDLTIGSYGHPLNAAALNQLVTGTLRINEANGKAGTTESVAVLSSEVSQ
jgi:hypothetical protein